MSAASSSFDVDVAVVGGGPAGYAMAALMSETHGHSVVIVDPDPEALWPNNYGEWKDEWETLSRRLGMPSLVDDCVLSSLGLRWSCTASNDQQEAVQQGLEHPEGVIYSYYDTSTCAGEWYTAISVDMSLGVTMNRPAVGCCPTNNARWQCSWRSCERRTDSLCMSAIANASWSEDADKGTVRSYSMTSLSPNS